MRFLIKPARAFIILALLGVFSFDMYANAQPRVLLAYDSANKYSEVGRQDLAPPLWKPEFVLINKPENSKHQSYLKIVLLKIFIIKIGRIS